MAATEELSAELPPEARWPLSVYLYLVGDRYGRCLPVHVRRLLTTFYRPFDARCVRTLQGHTKVACAVQWRDRLATSSDTTIRLWDVETGECLRTLEGHGTVVYCLLPWNGYLASGSWDGTVRLWDWDTGECRHVLDPEGSVWSLAEWDGDLVAGTVTCGAVVYNAALEEVHRLGELSAFSLCVWGNDLAVGGYGVIEVWTSGGEPVRTLRPNNGIVRALQAWRGHLVSGDDKGAITLWGDADEPVRQLQFHTRLVGSIAVWHGLLVCGSWDRTISVWHRTATDPCKQLLAIEDAHGGDINCVATFGSRYLVSASDDKTVRLWQ